MSGVSVMEFQLISSVDGGEWDALVSTSPQGSIFSDRRYLQSLEHPYECYLVKSKNDQVMGGVAIMGRKGLMSHAPFPFTPYQGIMFDRSVSSQTTHKRITSEFRITEYLINRLLECYENFTMAFSPAYKDLRPFLWHNYHDQSERHFNFRIRYTGILSFSDFESAVYLKSIRSVRRQENAKSLAEVVDTINVDEFIGIYTQTFQRQGIQLDEVTISQVRRICVSAIDGRYGRLRKAVVNGETASICLFIFDHQYAYYLFGANNPDFRNSGASSKLMIDNILHFSEQGLKGIDFVGVNSPNRGDFKLSFGPELVKYFEVELV